MLRGESSKQRKRGDFVTADGRFFRRPPATGARMTPTAVHASCKAISYVVLLVMVGTLAFAAYIAAIHWNGIGV
jgi:hypothetical protein